MPVIHVEVDVKSTSAISNPAIEDGVRTLVNTKAVSGITYDSQKYESQLLQDNVNSIMVSEPEGLHEKKVDMSSCSVQVHMYHLDEQGEQMEEVSEEEDIPAANIWFLPNQEFHGLWESLIYDSVIKTQLCSFVSTAMLFSERGVNDNIITWNRVALLHGPPGTGKTSLCKALAQKLSIRLNHVYKYSQLVEINAHSLFSKWFSESGKLVLKMFTKLNELLEDRQTMIFVLIDEVESLSAARSAAIEGREPSDAIRVVNALLTQIDNIRKYPNVLILTTSNITGAIDLAFVDRADIKQYIGLPTPPAIYQIYRSCINELMDKKIIYPQEVMMTLSVLKSLSNITENDTTSLSHRLHLIAQRSEGLSGRTLRKLPFLAHSLFIQSDRANLGEFLAALDQAVTKQFKDREELLKTDKT